MGLEPGLETGEFSLWAFQPKERKINNINHPRNL